MVDVLYERSNTDGTLTVVDIQGHLMAQFRDESAIPQVATRREITTFTQLVKETGSYLTLDEIEELVGKYKLE